MEDMIQVFKQRNPVLGVSILLSQNLKVVVNIAEMLRGTKKIGNLVETKCQALGLMEQLNVWAGW